MALPPEEVQLQMDADEAATYGLDLRSVKARLVQGPSRNSLVWADLHVSLEGTLNPRLPREKFSDDRFSLTLEMSKHPSFVTPAHVILEDIWDATKKRRIEIAQKISLGYRSTKLNPESVAFRLRCVDAAVGSDDWLKPLGKGLAKLAMQVDRTVRSCGCELKIRRSHARIVLHDPSDPEWASAAHYLGGDLILCSRGSENPRHLRSSVLVATLVDKEGFQLARNDHDLAFPSGASRHRSLTWAVAGDVDLPHLAGSPTAIRVRWDSDDEFDTNY
ncbi:hypothetical protein J2T11_003274 [Paenarthrobacter nicotinovorans]|nr:hypothetical protein [Paenarthrobacter nicotinovorans]